jgi:hypothetical protein
MEDLRAGGRSALFPGLYRQVLAKKKHGEIKPGQILAFGFHYSSQTNIPVFLSCGLLSWCSR